MRNITAFSRRVSAFTFKYREAIKISRIFNHEGHKGKEEWSEDDPLNTIFQQFCIEIEQKAQRNTGKFHMAGTLQQARTYL
jgi:hypothetical protein